MQKILYKDGKYYCEPFMEYGYETREEAARVAEFYYNGSVSQLLHNYVEREKYGETIKIARANTFTETD